MRVENWRAKEVFDLIGTNAMDNANAAMDEVVLWARHFCPVGSVRRPGGWSTANVEFTPQTGKNKGRLVQFEALRRWKGREPGDLRETIRRVNKEGSGSIRVYAGSYKIYWAFMTHRGYHDRAGNWHPGVPFLQRAFHEKKKRFLQIIKEGSDAAASAGVVTTPIGNVG